MEDSHKIFSNKLTKGLVVVILLGIITSLYAYTRLTLNEAKYVNSSPTTITVVGEGEVLAEPNIGQLSFSVRAEAEQASEAINQSATAVNRITEYLAEVGVADRDRKTTSYNGREMFGYEERICPEGSFCPRGNRYVSGYEVDQRIEIKIKDLTKVGEIIAGIGERGATNISSLSLTIEDAEQVEAEARAAAISDAKEKAKQLANDLGVELVRIVNYYENNQGFSGYGGEMMVRAMSDSEDSISPTIDVGENEIRSSVNIIYEVR